MFPENLKTLRLQNNLSQKELAKLIGLSSNIICEYEKARSQPNIDTLIKLSNIFNCSVDYLIGNENDFEIVQSSATSRLTKYQADLLSVFNLLSEDDQREVIGFAKGLAY